MNILLVTQFLSTTKGGGEYLFSLMANHLARKGHKIIIITHFVEGERYDIFHRNVRIHFVSTIKYEGGLPPSIVKNISFVSETFWLGIKLVKKEKIDVIHSNNFAPALVASLISTLTRCPHITALWDIFSLCGENYWSEWAKQENVSRLHAILGRRFEKCILLLKHDAIHTVSDASKEDLVKFGAKKPIHVISPSIDISENATNIVIKKQFVYVGRLVFYKNIHTIIKAIAIVKRQFPDVKLIIVGGGPQKQKLINLAENLQLQNNVEFKGFVSEHEKNDIISSSIAMLFPSLCEGFGLVILESFMYEKPVLVSNKKPLSDIVENNVDGFTIDAQNEKLWAEKIIQLLHNEEQAMKMGKRGKQKLINNYSLDRMIENIEDMYRTVRK